ncbi:MAG: hypothetical protein O3C10_14260, partial [Chloroflexi bacterium]|nr:hypothetical protein [Chloroflexota bacterium]
MNGWLSTIAGEFGARNMDQAKAEAFGDRIVDTLNAGSLALMTSIGHRTGLFDSMAGMAHSSSDQ